MSLCVHCTKTTKQPKAITKQWCHILNYKIYKFVLYDTLHQTLKIPCVGIFLDLWAFVCVGMWLECDNSNLNTNFFKIFTNTLFKWILHLTSMTKRHLQHSWLKYFEMPKRIFFHQMFNQWSWFDKWNAFDPLSMGCFFH
jgi:hypothetical protein